MSRISDKGHHYRDNPLYSKLKEQHNWTYQECGVKKGFAFIPIEVHHIDARAKWLVETSSLPHRVRGRLLSRMDSAGDMIDSAFEIGGNLNKLHGASGQLRAFINMMDDDDFVRVS